MEAAKKLSLPVLLEKFLNYSFDENIYSRIIDAEQIKELRNGSEIFYTGYKTITPDDDWDLLTKYRTRYLTFYQTKINGYELSVKHIGYVAKRSNSILHSEVLYKLGGISPDIMDRIRDMLLEILTIEKAGESDINLSNSELNVELNNSSGSLEIKISGQPSCVENLLREIFQVTIFSQQPFQTL